MENNKIKRANIVVPLIAALLIVIVGKLNINWYFESCMFPFLMVVISSTILVIHNKDINKKAYYWLIPIMLIIFSNLILSIFGGRIDGSNELLNIVLLPIIISMYLFSLINNNYKISLKNALLMFKLFPTGLFENLKYLKINENEKKNKKVFSFLLGILIGTFFAVIILKLLTSADDYFNIFLSKLVVNIDFNFNIWIIIKFIVFFIILFVIGINLFKNKDLRMREVKIKNIDKTMIISMLSVINCVFLLFLVSEISKLCGNFLHIPEGYIYSSYAREGFFQLLFVTLINFSIIVYLMYKTKLIKENRWVRILVILLIVFQVALIFNSYYRMFLYIGKFGFTALRLQVILFLLMELVLFGILIKKVVGNIKNDGLIFIVVMIVTYIINLYLCNDLFIRFIS